MTDKLKSKAPDPSPDCPRCHYFERTAEVRTERPLRQLWPLGIDQHKAQDILTKAFPPTRRS